MNQSAAKDLDTANEFSVRMIFISDLKHQLICKVAQLNPLNKIIINTKTVSGRSKHFGQFWICAWAEIFDH